jgi:TPP-dependent indolepyruvate ferredoxin oxidoreductase alpha subunit
MVKKALSLVELEKLIDKGAPLKEETKIQKSEEWTNINIRISKDMLSEIDESVKARVGITRTGWILETLYERLKGLNG